MGSGEPPIDPFGNDRGVHGQLPLRSGIRLATTESMMWDRLHRRLWPNATTMQREELCNRMMRTLQAEPSGCRMTGVEVTTRLKQMQLSLDRLPPDPHNKLMGG